MKHRRYVPCDCHAVTVTGFSGGFAMRLFFSSSTCVCRYFQIWPHFFYLSNTGVVTLFFTCGNLL